MFLLDSQANTVKPFPLWKMIAAVAFYILACALQWELVEILTPFLMLPFLAGCFIVTGIVCVLCIVKTIRYRKAHGVSHAGWIGFIVVVLFFASLFIPLDDLYEKARFSMLSTSFDNAAHEINEMDMGTGVIPLPMVYTGLSRGGGEVIVSGEGEDKVILFYSYRGILDNFSVYAYAPNRQAYGTLLEYETWLQIIPIRDNWYFCSST